MMQSARTVLALAAAILAVALSGCEQKPAADRAGPAEQAGQQIDRATSRAGEEFNKLGEKVGQSMEKAGQKLQDEAKQAQKSEAKKEQ